MTFEIKKPRYNKETIEAINEAIKMMKNPKKEMSYNNINDFMEDLNSEDEWIYDWNCLQKLRIIAF